MDKQSLFGKDMEQLRQLSEQLGLPRFASRQITGWLYKKNVDDISGMTDISESNRQKLSERFKVGRYAPQHITQSKDGTRKYLFEVCDGHSVEAVFIPDRDRATLCVSSQAGCKMGCAFCMTGRQGFQYNMTAGEILNQVASLPEFSSLTNIVYMGMGEPLDNTEQVLRSIDIMTSDWGYGWSPGRITLSTIGVIPGLELFLRDSKANLAVSLHNPFSDERQRMMPVEKVYPIEQVINLLKQYDFSHQRRLSFEYIMFEGINDSDRHVKGLVKLLNGLRCRINLIRFHAVPDFPHSSPSNEKVVRFRDMLTSKGIMTTVRASRGEDIQAACGMLSTMERLKNKQK